jgi:hypothetical protein
MKKFVPFLTLISLSFLMVFISSCSHKYYTAAEFEDLTMDHKTVAILPAEMIFTGTKPKNMTPEDIKRVEEFESQEFQQSLFDNILRYANTNRYMTAVNFQDIQSTRKMLEVAEISIRDSWTMSNSELAKYLGVDAVVRMRIQKQRYMSDIASYGIEAGRQILSTTKIFIPPVNNKTNDIITSCTLISNDMALWNDHYTRAADYNTSSREVIENITANFGKHFPYRKKR